MTTFALLLSVLAVAVACAPTVSCILEEGARRERRRLAKLDFTDPLAFQLWKLTEQARLLKDATTAFAHRLQSRPTTALKHPKFIQ